MEVLRWRARQTGLLDLGHHIIIDRTGGIHLLRPIDVVGCHTPGHNHNSLSVCVLGGISEEGDLEDNYTAPQRTAMQLVFAMFLREWPEARIVTRYQIQKRRGDKKPSFNPHQVIRTAVSDAKRKRVRKLGDIFKRTPPDERPKAPSEAGPRLFAERPNPHADDRHDEPWSGFPDFPCS